MVGPQPALAVLSNPGILAASMCRLHQRVYIRRDFQQRSVGDFTVNNIGGDIYHVLLSSGIKFAGYIPPTDVRNLPDRQASEAYHDPSISGDSNVEGPAVNDGGAWTSLVDGIN